MRNRFLGVAALLCVGVTSTLMRLSFLIAIAGVTLFGRRRSWSLPRIVLALRPLPANDARRTSIFLGLIRRR